MEPENHYVAIWRRQLAAKRGLSPELVTDELNILVHFWLEWRRLRVTWAQLSALLEEHEDISLLWSTIPRFLAITVDSMWRDLIVSQATLIDTRRDVASLHKWWSCHGSKVRGNCQATAHPFIQQYEASIAGIEAVRHNHVAHVNLAKLLDKQNFVVHMHEMDVALDILDKTIGQIFANYEMLQLDRVMEPEGGGDLSTLIEWIKASQQEGAS